MQPTIAILVISMFLSFFKAFQYFNSLSRMCHELSHICQLEIRKTILFLHNFVGQPGLAFPELVFCWCLLAMHLTALFNGFSGTKCPKTVPLTYLIVGSDYWPDFPVQKPFSYQQIDRVFLCGNPRTTREGQQKLQTF